MDIKQKQIQTPRTRSGSLTRQRQLVLEVLKDTSGHLDAGMVYQEARKRDERISLATVYRSLDFLVKEGLIKESSLGLDQAHFEVTTKTQHFHFMCLECGEVIELDAADIHDSLNNACQAKNLQISETHLYVRGICDNCRAKTKNPKR